ncbi:cytochrome c oxidase subunit 6b, partial [Tremellales sp. Uapishka_1]
MSEGEKTYVKVGVEIDGLHCIAAPDCWIRRPVPQYQPDETLLGKHTCWNADKTERPLIRSIIQQNYVDYHKCVNAKGEEFAPCKQFKRAYQSLCPNEWAGRWDEEVENGTFPASLKP